MNNKGVKKVHLNLSFKICFAVSLIVLGLLLFLVGINNVETENNVTPIFYYNVSKDAKYSVNLAPNTFFDTTVLGEDKEYPAFLVENYKTTLTYGINSSLPSTYQYTYDVVAEIIGTSSKGSSNEEVWTKKYTLIPERRATVNNSSEFLIKEDVTIDYGVYNNLAREFEKRSGLNVNTTLRVRLNVHYNIDLSELKQENEIINDSVEVLIALSNDLTRLEKKFDESTSHSVYPEKESIQDSRSISKFFAVVGFIMMFVGGAVTASLILTRTLTKEEKYIKNMNSILKEYSDLIVTVQERPNFSNLYRMKLSSLDDLVDAAEQNHVNILHFEKVQNRLSELFVVTDRYYFQYDVTSNNLK